MRRLLCILLALISMIMGAETLDKLIPSHSPILSGYNDIDSVKLGIDQRGVAGIEGIWELAGTQSIVVIEPCTMPSINATGIHCLQIVVVSSPRRSTRPGTVLGYMIPTARAGYYDARLYTTSLRSVLQNHRRYTMRLTDDAHLSMTPVKSRWRVTLRHSFNFLVRAGITQQPSEDNQTEGFVKLYPLNGLTPLKPVYL